MVQFPWQLAATPLARAWRRRLRALQASLTQEPPYADAWRWQIELRILSYLLARYGTDLTIRRPPWPRIDHTHMERYPTTPPRGRPPRSRAAIRSILERIAEANRGA